MMSVDRDDSGSSEDELFPETDENTASPIENIDVGRLQLDLGGTRVKYKVYELCYRYCCMVFSKFRKTLMVCLDCKAGWKCRERKEGKQREEGQCSPFTSFRV